MTKRISCVFQDEDQVDADPTTVSLVVMEPNGTVTIYTYAGTDITKDSTGHYHYDLFLDAALTWDWRFIGTGTVAQVDQGSIYVEPINTQ